MEFTFKHMLIREVAYSTVPRSTRRERHAAIARYVEEAIQGSGETLAGVLAHHWQEAGEDARAIPYLLEAAEAAFRGWAQGAVDDLYAKAIDLAKDQTLRLQIRLKRGIALVRLGEYELATSELSALAAELEGEDRLQALLAWGRATLWRERDVETIQIAQQALALAQELRAENAKPPALALLSQAHAMRGMAGDLDRALDLGERALATWSPGRHEYDRAEHLHLHADTAYWTGRYERCAELARSARSLSADVHSAEGLLRGGGIEALALVALGRHEEAIRIWDEMFTLAKELGANRRVILNYSSIAYRELLDIEEARRRSEEALELSADESFGMPRRFAQSDLLFTDLLTADVGRAQTAWPKLWDDAGSATGWTKWLIYGRLAAARAEIALRAEAPDSAVEWAHRSLKIARRTRRRKYEARSLAILGQALILCGRHATALKELEAGVVVADSLVGPPARWDARAALARAAYAVGNDELADTAHSEAVALVESFASTLSPGRREAFRRAVSIRDALSSGGVDC